MFALALGAAVALVVWWKTPEAPTRRPFGFWDGFMILIFSCASWRAFFWLIYPDGDWWRILSPNNLGDISLHISLIHWLAATQQWWPASPILAGDPLRYPPGSDLFNSLLLIAGLPSVTGLVWFGLLGSALTGYSLWRWGGAVGLAALLFNGGCAGFLFLKTGWGADPDALCEWKNLFLTLFVTQRGFLFALPAGLLLLAAWREESFEKPRTVILPLPVQTILLGSIPLFSIHAALFLGVSMAGLFLLAPVSRHRMARLALSSWPVMAFLGWLVTSGAGGPSAVGSIGLCPGWMGDGTVGFWFWNFGIMLPLCLLLTLLLFRKGGDDEARAFVWPAAFVFVLCMIIRFAPWPWDNMKLMLWSWIVTAPYLWSVLLSPRTLPLRVAALVLLFGSGVATLGAGLDGRHGYELVERPVLEQTAGLMRGIAPDTVIACAPEYNHPVLMTGHRVVCGYEGHLWSHGLDYRSRWDRLDSLMRGAPGWRDEARILGVGAIYWGPLEAARWPDSKLPWAGNTNVPSLHLLQ